MAKAAVLATLMATSVAFHVLGVPALSYAAFVVAIAALAAWVLA